MSPQSKNRWVMIAAGFGGLFILALIVGRACSPTPSKSNVPLPSDEKGLCAVVDAQAGGAGNAAAAASSRAARKAAMAGHDESDGKASAWVGKLDRIDTTGNGKVAVIIKLACSDRARIGTWNSDAADVADGTLIDEASPLASKLDAMPKGSLVIFSGWFLIGNQKDHLEGSQPHRCRVRERTAVPVPLRRHHEDVSGPRPAHRPAAVARSVSSRAASARGRAPRAQTLLTLSRNEEPGAGAGGGEMSVGKLTVFTVVTFLSGLACSGGPGGAGPQAGGGGSDGAGTPPSGGSPNTGPSPSPTPKNCAAPMTPGATWTEIPAPAVTPGFAVTDAWPAGTDDFFFVGTDPSPDGGNTPSTRRQVLRWSQGCWSIELAADGGPYATPQISGTAPDDVWLTTGDAIYHRDASGWSPLDPSLASALAPLPGNLLILTDVQARTRDDVWFTEQDTILHLLNGQWHMQQLSVGPPGQTASITYGFNRISILGENDVWIGGGSDQIGNTMDPASLYHFDGQSWTIHNVGVFHVNALWPVGAGDAFWLAMPPDSLEPLSIRQFANDAVTVPAVAGWSPSIEATSLWGRAPNDVWAAGEDIAHFDGSAWSRVADAPDAVRDLHGLHVDSVVTGDANVTWLVGVGPHFFRKAAGAAP